MLSEARGMSTVISSAKQGGAVVSSVEQGGKAIFSVDQNIMLMIVRAPSLEHGVLQC